jgi:hypothetical protein
MKPVIRCLMGALLLLATVVPLAAQGPQPASETAGQPLQVQIVIARYQGEKRTSSLPFSLSTSTAPASKANVRMGGNVAVPSAVFTTPGDGAKPGTSETQRLTSFNYQDVGTNIDVTTVQGASGRIGLTVTISETTLKPADQGAQINAPGRGTYQSQNTVFVKDGETTQFTAATDRLTGEVVRIEVTAKILK